MDPYKIAYDRERAARLHAEKLLDEKTRTLFDHFNSLQSTLIELKRAQDHLIQSEKMASIGQLAAGVAHEINNPIGFSLSNMNSLGEYLEAIYSMDSLVMGHIANLKDHDFAKMYLALRAEKDIEFIAGDSQHLLADSIKGLHRVSDIVKSLKKVTHASSDKLDHCNVNDLIEESIKVVWNELKYSMQLERHFDELPSIDCHEGEIHQVFMNLFINAAHACEGKDANNPGILSITTRLQTIDGKQTIAIDINDNGKGMSKATMTRIFDPFFTTKPVGVGTGLGLSISFGIIQRHGGKISVSSEEGVGTTFTVYLPCTEKK